MILLSCIDEAIVGTEQHVYVYSADVVVVARFVANTNKPPHVGQ